MAGERGGLPDRDGLRFGGLRRQMGVRRVRRYTGVGAEGKCSRRQQGGMTQTVYLVIVVHSVLARHCRGPVARASAPKPAAVASASPLRVGASARNTVASRARQAASCKGRVEASFISHDVMRGILQGVESPSGCNIVCAWVC